MTTHDDAYPLPGPIALRGNLRAALGEAESSPSPVRNYRRAWVLAASGRYGDALALIDDAREQVAPVAPAAHALRASVLRQVRLYERAEAADRAGLELLGDLAAQSTADAPRDVVADIAANLAIGLVADAVGHVQIEPHGGHEAACTERLSKARAAVDEVRAATRSGRPAGMAGGTAWRQLVRVEWVAGEVALTTGDVPAAARAFVRARRLAAARGARRHEAKAMLFLAAARAADQELGIAGRLAAAALRLARACGAAPLTWPARLILAEVVESRGALGAAVDERVYAAQTLAGLINGLPQPLRAEARARAAIPL